MPDDGQGIDVASEDIDAAQEVLLGLQNATAKATQELNNRKAKALAEERGLVDLDYSQPDNGGTDAKKVVRVAMFFGYNGSGYHGMQVNPGVRTIEAEMHKALVEAQAIPTCAETKSSKSTGKETVSDDFRSCKWGRAARTDKGVSAAGQVVAFNMTLRADMASRLNAVLPDQILVYGFKRAEVSFDARTCCSSRKYEYWLPEWAFDPDLIPAKPSWRPKSCPCDAAVLPKDAPVPEGEEIREVTTRTGQELRLRPGYQMGAPPTNSKFTFDAECEAHLNAVLGEYEGVHNFHNFTPAALAEQMSAQRMMFSVCSGGVHEFGEPPHTKRWVRMDIHGQSFLLNQIRKMIGMAIAVYRGVAPRNGIEIATDPQRNFGTPLAPELGLLLAECLYEAYNSRRKNGLDELSVDGWEGRIERFKQDRIYPMIKSKDEAESVNYRFIVSLNEENFQFSKWVAAPVVNKSLKRPRSREQKEEASKRERIRAARKDELVAQGLELVQVHDMLRQEFPRPYLRGDSDFRPKQACITGVGNASSGAGASTSAAATYLQSPGGPLPDPNLPTAEFKQELYMKEEPRVATEDAATEQAGDASNRGAGGSAVAELADQADEVAAPVPVEADAAAPQPAERPVAGDDSAALVVAAVAAEAVAQAEQPVAAEAPDAAAAAVAEFIRVGVPAGAAEDDGDGEEGSDGGMEGSEDSALVARGFVARDDAGPVQNDGVARLGGHLGDVGGSDDGESDGDADESEQEQVLHA